MSPHLNVQLTTIIGLIGTFQGLVLAGAVASLRGPGSRPNRVLALVLATFSVSVGAIVLEHAAFFSSSIGLILVEYTFLLLFPPALWHYADTVLGRRTGVPFWIHLVPAGLWIGYVLTLGLGWPSRGPVAWRWLPPILALVMYLTTYTVIIAVRTWRGVSKPRALISHAVVLRVLVVLLFVLHAAQFLRFLFRNVGPLSDIVPVTSTLIVYAISILAFRQSRLFAGHEVAHLKYDSSTLTPDRADEIKKQLLEVMDRDKPYLNENLNLSEMASRLGVSRSHFSQVVNSDLGISFPELLNEYRVREARRLLADPTTAHLTVEAIGYEVGFGSRSGFYDAFKRISGETPAQVRSNLS